MVNDIVSIKKPFNYKKLFLSLFGIIFVLAILVIIFFLGSIFGDEPDINITFKNPVSEVMDRLEQQSINISKDEIIEQAELEFNSEYITYALYAMSAYKLHNPLFSSDTPKINVVLDGTDNYYSEVVDGKITTFQESVGENDINIISTKKEIINAMLADDISEFMSDSVRNGGTGIEMVGGNLKLASKGYLQMYEDITGESLI